MNLHTDKNQFLNCLYILIVLYVKVNKFYKIYPYKKSVCNKEHLLHTDFLNLFIKKISLEVLSFFH